MKKATIYVNGREIGYYIQTPKQTEEQFKDEVTKAQSWAVRLAYKYFNAVKSEVVFEDTDIIEVAEG